MFIVISTLTLDQTLSKDKSTLQLYNISHRVYLLHIFTLESRNPFATSHYITNAQKSTVVGLFLFFVFLFFEFYNNMIVLCNISSALADSRRPGPLIQDQTKQNTTKNITEKKIPNPAPAAAAPTDCI